jgi:hypothetical protein
MTLLLRRPFPVAGCQLRRPLTTGRTWSRSDRLRPGSRGRGPVQEGGLMVSPKIAPEDGVTRYQHDHTQGPACAIAHRPKRRTGDPWFAITAAQWGEVVTVD